LGVRPSPVYRFGLRFELLMVGGGWARRNCVSEV
jgi:hypothetical protein